MTNSKIDGLIGLAQRGRFLIISGEKILEANPAKVTLVIVAIDLVESGRDKLVRWATANKKPILFYRNKEELGHIIGKNYVGALAITNRNLAKAISAADKKMKEGVLDGESKQ